MTARDRRALVLGVAIVGLSLALRGLPLAVSALVRLRRDVSEGGIRVQRMRDDVRAVGALSDSALVVRQQFLGLAPRILAGGTEAEAVADLTNRLSMLAAAHAATFGRADAVPDSARVGWLRRVTVRVAFQSDLRGTLATLEATAHEPAVLAIRSVRLMAPDPASDDAVPEIVAAEATVSGWFLLRKEDR